MDGFKGQEAVITGAGSGIGRAISHNLLKHGARVAILDVNEYALKKEFDHYKPAAELYPIDITRESMVNDTIEAIVRLFKKIDILINCAGITGSTNVLSHEVCSEDLHKVFELNFMGSFYITKAVLPHMLKMN